MRFFFHGRHLNDPAIASAELYSYSLLWLFYGLMLVWWSVRKKDVFIRRCALLLIVVVVFKVFLWDASALDGLYRVLSFLGLGTSLLGLSWVYTRYFLSDEKGEKGLTRVD